MWDPIGPQHCVVPQCTSVSGVLLAPLLGSEDDAMSNLSLMMPAAEPEKVLTFTKGEVVCICKGGVVRELSDSEIDKGLSDDVTEQRFELKGQSAVVAFKDNKSEHGILGEFLQQCPRQDGQDIQIQGHSVVTLKNGKYTVKPQPDLSNLFCFPQDESLLFNVLPSVFFKH